MNDNQDIYVIGKIDAFAARNTDLYLNTKTGECYYIVFDTKVGIMDDTGKVAELVEKFYRERRNHPAPESGQP